MALSAKLRILKLRETEYKLHRLQNDLSNVDDTTKNSALMSEFLSHHKELMDMPGRSRDSLPARFNFETLNHYAEMKQTQKLTLPPKIPSKSANRLRPFQVEQSEQLEAQDSNGIIGAYKGVLSEHRPLALQSLLSELDRETSRAMFPKLDKLTVRNKMFLRELRSRNSRIHNNSTGMKSNSTAKSFRKGSESKLSVNVPLSSTKSSLLKRGPPAKIKLMFNHQLNEKSSTAPASGLDVGAGSTNSKSKNEYKRKKSDERRNDIPYALGVSNLMGVILPTRMSSPTKTGSKIKKGKKLPAFVGTLSTKDLINYGNGNVITKKVATVLRQRELAERKAISPSKGSLK